MASAAGPSVHVDQSELRDSSVAILLPADVNGLEPLMPNHAIPILYVHIYLLNILTVIFSSLYVM
jgi:hypothetical protein